MNYILPIAAVTVIGCICAVLLAVAASFFAVKSDERFDEVRSCLPGINCSACGYANCDEYAKGILNGDVITKCRPGGKKTVDKLSQAVGAKDEEKCKDEDGRVAEVKHTKRDTEEKSEYDGVKTCAASNLVNAGQKASPEACLGYGDCVRVCGYDAIEIKNTVAHINPDKCTGCGACVGSCPKSIIKTVLEKQ